MNAAEINLIKMQYNDDMWQMAYVTMIIRNAIQSITHLTVSNSHIKSIV